MAAEGISKTLALIILTTSFVLTIGAVGSWHFTSEVSLQVDQSMNPKPDKVFVLVAQEWGYNQTQGGPTLVVNEGDLVRITLKVPGSISHNLRIDEFNFVIGGGLGIRNNEVDTGEFVADIKGEFSYYCRLTTYSGHRALGMEGKIIVQ